MYVESNLMDGERIAFKFKWHWAYYVIPVLLIPFLIGIPLLIYRVLLNKTSDFAITDRRMLGKYGILSQTVIDVPLDRVDNLNLSQGLIDRIFNAGQISFKNDGEYITIPLLVSDPRMAKTQFSETQHQYKSKLYSGKL